MTNRMAEIISALLHPVFLPSYFTVFLISASLLEVSGISSVVLLAVLFVFTAVLPVVSFYILKRTGWISNFNMESRQERSYPLLFTLLFNVLFLYLAGRFHTSAMLSYVVMISAFTIIMSWAVNVFIRLSLHVAAWTALAATTLWFLKMNWLPSPVYIIIPLVITGIVASARLKLKAHDGTEVIFGAITGLLSVILTNYVIFRMA